MFFFFEKHIASFLLPDVAEKEWRKTKWQTKQCVSFFPLKIITYPQGEYGLEDNPVEITPAEAVTYEDAILAAIANRYIGERHRKHLRASLTCLEQMDRFCRHNVCIKRNEA